MTTLRHIQTDGAPAAIGPYAQAIVTDGWIFTSGQIAMDADTGDFQGGDVRQQTQQVLENLQAVLESAGGSWATTVRTTVYLADIDDFAAMNEVYAEHLGSHRPARTTVQAARLPRDARVEIDAVARVDS